MQRCLGVSCVSIAGVFLTSCATWYPLRKDQLPPIAEAFQTGKRAELEVPGPKGPVLVRVGPDNRFEFRSGKTRIHRGRLEELELKLDDGVEHLRLVPGVAGKQARLAAVHGKSGQRELEVPLDTVDAIAVECGRSTPATGRHSAVANHPASGRTTVDPARSRSESSEAPEPPAKRGSMALAIGVVGAAVLLSFGLLVLQGFSSGLAGGYN